HARDGVRRWAFAASTAPAGPNQEGGTPRPGPSARALSTTPSESWRQRARGAGMYASRATGRARSRVGISLARDGALPGLIAPHRYGVPTPVAMRTAHASDTKEPRTKEPRTK